MQEKQLKTALKLYKVSASHIYPVQKGYRNQSFQILLQGQPLHTPVEQNLNLIIYKSEPGILARIKRADALSEHAFKAGLAVRHLYDKRIITLKSKTKTSYARLYHYLPGETISWEAYTQKHIKLLGWAMSDLHSAIKTAQIILPNAIKENQELLSRIQAYFANKNVQKAMRMKLGLNLQKNLIHTLQEVLSESNKLPAQSIHLDLVRGNILFENAKSNPAAGWTINNLTLSGLIDFEKSAKGPLILDFARTYAFLLVDCVNKPPEKIFKYLIHSGYNKRGGSHINFSEQSKRLFNYLVTFYLLHDFYKFLLHNPYESLKDNHHYQRTKTILLSKNVLKYV